MRAHPAGPRHGEILAPAGAPPLPADAEALHALTPGVWPSGARRSDEGGLAARSVTIAGVDVRDLAADFGTPLFVLDEADFRSRAAAFREAYDDAEVPADVFYAGKAFLSATVARWVAEEGLNLDVCTGGELITAVRAGFPADRIAFHGNNKSVAELELALAARGGPLRRRLVRGDRPPRRRGRPCRAWWPTSSCASPSASRRTPTSSSRPRTRTRSSGSRSPGERPRRPCAAS